MYNNTWLLSGESLAHPQPPSVTCVYPYNPIVCVPPGTYRGRYSSILVSFAFFLSFASPLFKEDKELETWRPGLDSHGTWMTGMWQASKQASNFDLMRNNNERTKY